MLSNIFECGREIIWLTADWRCCLIAFVCFSLWNKKTQTLGVLVKHFGRLVIHKKLSKENIYEVFWFRETGLKPYRYVRTDFADQYFRRHRWLVRGKFSWENQTYMLLIITDMSGLTVSLCKNIKNFVRSESHINIRTQCVIMTLAGDRDGGLPLMTFWNSEKLSNLKVQLW